MPPKVNAKAAAALERRAEQEASNARKKEMEDEKKAEQEWNVGSNTRAASRQKEVEDQAAVKAAKKAELAALLQEEEGSVTVTGKKPKKKGKDDFDKLNEALASAPKTKAQRMQEEKKKSDEERRKKDEESRKLNEERKRKQEEERRAAAARGIVLDHGDEMMVENRNRIDAEFEEASGIEASLEVLSMEAELPDNHPEKRQKALYNAYYERMLPLLKREHPGLRLSQYKERIFDMWKTAPENPRYAASVLNASATEKVASSES